MASLMVPVSTHTRGYAFGLDKSKPHEVNGQAIQFQGDVGWGVSKRDRWNDERAHSRAHRT